MAFSSLFTLISNFHLSILPFVESLRCSAQLLPSWGRHWCTCCLRPRQQRRRHWRLVLPATSSHIFIHLPSDLLHPAHDSMVQYNWRNPNHQAHHSPFQQKLKPGILNLKTSHISTMAYTMNGVDGQNPTPVGIIKTWQVYWVFTISTAYLFCVHQKHHRITWAVIYWMVEGGSF